MRKFGIIILLFVQSLVWAEQTTERPIRVGLLLPLQVNVQQRNWSMDRFADFYTGALLAVYEIQSKHQPVEVSTFDVGKSVEQLEDVLNGGALDSMDMIIGPAYPQQVRTMASWAQLHQVHTLLPFTWELPELPHNPYLLQFNPSLDTEAEVMAEYLANQEHWVRCIFVEADSADIPESVGKLQQRIKEEGLTYAYTTISRIMNDSLNQELADSAENVLLMNTERYANIRQVLPQLTRAAQGKQLTLLSRYSWQNDPIVLPQLYSTVFVHEEPTDTACYNALYRRFVNQPRVQSRPCYDLLGYDMMMYSLLTIHSMRLMDVDWGNDDIVGRPYNGMQSNIRFERIDSVGGYYNANVQVIRKQ